MFFTYIVRFYIKRFQLYHQHKACTPEKWTFIYTIHILVHFFEKKSW